MGTRSRSSLTSLASALSTTRAPEVARGNNPFFSPGQCRHLAPGGMIAYTVWRFDRFERFTRKLVPWQEFSDKIDGLEPGDHIMTWGDAEPAYRYCHAMTDEEAEALKNPAAAILEPWRPIQVCGLRCSDVGADRGRTGAHRERIRGAVREGRLPARSDHPTESPVSVIEAVSARVSLSRGRTRPPWRPRRRYSPGRGSRRAAPARSRAWSRCVLRSQPTGGRSRSSFR